MTKSLPFGQFIADQKWFILASALLMCAFFMGGSSRPEVSSLSLLRPLGVLACGVGLMALQKEDVQKYAPILLIAATLLVLSGLQIVPLPPEVAGTFAGHKLIAEIGDVVGTGPVWRPMSMVPGATWNAIGALTVPAAMMLLVIKCPNDRQVRLLPIIFGLGAVSALVAMLQILGDPQSALYFYDVTNEGLAVGLFANRNHQAVFLAALLPLLFAYKNLPRDRNTSTRGGRIGNFNTRTVVAVTAATLIIPLILISGSRSGLLAMTVALLGVALVSPRLSEKSSAFGMSARAQASALIVGMIILVLLAIWFGRGLAVDRLMDQDTSDDMRYVILPVMQDMISAYAPWGSGFGSFDKVYRANEPGGLLIAQYMNQAHNDWIDILLTGGIPAMALAVTACGAWAFRAFQVFSDSSRDAWQPLRKAALVVLLIFAIASASDYPLRTPALACFFMLVIFWAAIPLKTSQPHNSSMGEAVV